MLTAAFEGAHMRSKASYDGHPLHPALIPFPFAFLIGAFVFDALGWLFSRPTWWETGGHLAAAGVLAGVAAAIPGIIDYIYTVPPRSTGKQRATRHMLLNSSALLVVAVAWVLRDTIDELLVLAMELVAAGLLIVGGWMGGVLVSRNQISVDHRYADAGKWNELAVTVQPGTAARVASADELKVNQLKLLHINGKRVVLGRTEDGYVAFDDRCTHRGGSLAGGTMICSTVQCPWHGSQFDVRSGSVNIGPAKQHIKTYPVEIRGDAILLSI
jgi:nitrite reductase/ring-hydroxylating ferredoxin subunit/uncharacterized membrane protein